MYCCLFTDIAGTVESVKAASDVYAPVSGTVKQKNIDAENEPKLINTSPFTKGNLICSIQSN
jgi:glycine cleavage system H protein